MMAKKKVVVPENKKKEVIPINEKKPIDKQISLPGKYEITPDDTFTVDVYMVQKKGRWVVVKKKEDEAEENEVVFRMWSFSEEIELRKMSTNFDHAKRIHLIDHDLLNRLKIQRLLKSWTFDKDNPRLKLLHVNGVLTDESYESFMNLHPNICRHILEEMNGILEYNG